MLAALTLTPARIRLFSRPLSRILRPLAPAMLAALCLGLPAAPARADDAPKPADAPVAQPAPPPAPAADAPEQASDEQVRAAELKVKRLELELLQARLELLRLRPQSEIERLEEQARAAEAALAPALAAEEGFIRDWLLLGPIAVDEKVSNHDEQSCREMLDRAYVPADAKPREGDKVTIDGAELEWKAARADDYFVDLTHLAEEAGKEGDHTAYLGVVYVTADQELADVKLAVGSDDDCVWRLNGKEVIRAYEGRPVDKDQNAAEGLTLKQGVNVLTFTVLNGEGPAAAAARFLDKDGNPIKDLKVSATPPGQP